MQAFPGQRDSTRLIGVNGVQSLVSLITDHLGQYGKLAGGWQPQVI